MIQFNDLLAAFLAFFIFRAFFQLVLTLVNYYHLRKHGDRVPRVFKDYIDREKFFTIAAYTADSVLLSFFSCYWFFTVEMTGGFLPGLLSLHLN